MARTGLDTPSESRGWTCRSSSRAARIPAPPVKVLLKSAFVNVFLNLPSLVHPSQVFPVKSKTIQQLVENLYFVSPPIVQITRCFRWTRCWVQEVLAQRAGTFCEPVTPSQIQGEGGLAWPHPHGPRHLPGEKHSGHLRSYCVLGVSPELWVHRETTAPSSQQLTVPYVSEKHFTI